MLSDEVSPHLEDKSSESKEALTLSDQVIAHLQDQSGGAREAVRLTGFGDRRASADVNDARLRHNHRRPRAARSSGGRTTPRHEAAAGRRGMERRAGAAHRPAGAGRGLPGDP